MSLRRKLDQILKLTQNCNSALKRIELQSDSRHVDNLMAEDDIFVSFEVTSSPIPTNVYTRDGDTSDVEHESGVESIMTTLSYPLYSQPLEFFTIIHQVVSGFFFLLVGV